MKINIETSLGTLTCRNPQRLQDDTLTFRELTLDSESDKAGCRVLLDIAIDRRGRGRCTKLELFPSRPGAAVTGDLMRKVPVAPLVRAAVIQAGTWAGTPRNLPGGVTEMSALSPSERKSTAKRISDAQASPRGRGLPVTDDHLAEVAQVYREAMEAAGRKRPKEAVMDAFEAKPATASKWIKRARARGYLGPAQHGRASG